MTRNVLETYSVLKGRYVVLLRRYVGGDRSTYIREPRAISLLIFNRVGVFQMMKPFYSSLSWTECLCFLDRVGATFLATFYQLGSCSLQLQLHRSSRIYFRHKQCEPTCQRGYRCCMRTYVLHWDFLLVIVDEERILKSYGLSECVSSMLFACVWVCAMIVPKFD